MRLLFIICLLGASSILYSQSYVDLGIRHFAVREYDEALVDFKEAEKIVSMITESSKAKMYYYRGMIWLIKAEEAAGDFAEENPIQLSYQDLSKVLTMDKSWEPQIKEAYGRLYVLMIDQANSYLKSVKKEDGMEGKISWLDERISYLNMARVLDVSTEVNLFLGQTHKQAGDLYFEVGNSLNELQKAEQYYRESLKYYEQARYDDPFSKEIIEDLLTLSRRLADKERITEYEKLLKLAGG